MKKILVGFLLLLLLVAAAAAGAWKLSPGFRETVYLAGLFSGVDAIEGESASALVDYPTARAAVALIAYTNLQYRPPFDGAYWRRVYDHPKVAPDPVATEMAGMLEEWGCLAEGAGAAGLRALEGARKVEVSECAHGAVAADEEVRRDQAQVASRAVWTLCKLSGQDFGTDCDPEARGVLASTLSNRQWETALSSINEWGKREFGDEALAGLDQGGQVALQQVIRTSYPELRP